MGQKPRVIRLFSASLFNPMKIRCIGQGYFPPNGTAAIAAVDRLGRGTVLCVDTSHDRVWDALVPARAAPEFRGFRRQSAIGDCEAASSGEALRARSSRALKLVITRVYAYNRPQKSRSESLHTVRGSFHSCTFRTETNDVPAPA